MVVRPAWAALAVQPQRRSPALAAPDNLEQLVLVDSVPRVAGVHHRPRKVPVASAVVHPREMVRTRQASTVVLEASVAMAAALVVAVAAAHSAVEAVAVASRAVVAAGVPEVRPPLAQRQPQVLPVRVSRALAVLVLLPGPGTGLLGKTASLRSRR